MSTAGYIYVRNWDRYQYRADRRLPWIKLYAELLDDDDYLGLSLADRGLLQDLWKLASLSGDGRVSADRVSLARRLNVRRVSLEPLIQAGYIEIRAHKRRRDDALEQSRAEETALKAVPSTRPKDDAMPEKPALEQINGEPTKRESQWKANLIIRTDSLGKLLLAIGAAADESTEKTLLRIIRRDHVSQYELERTREATLCANTTDRARYAVGTLKHLVQERTA